MVNRHGAYGFNWKEWASFVALFLSYLTQTALIILLYKAVRSRLWNNLHRINTTVWETEKQLDEIQRILANGYSTERKAKTWLRKS